MMRFIRGNDFFISYPRADALDYALSIAKELDAKKYTCFLDQLGTRPGKELPNSLLRQIKRSSVFLLVGSSGALDSESIGREIEVFKATGRPILPVDFGSIRDASWYSKIDGIPDSSDSQKNLEAGTPSEGVLLRAEKSLFIRNLSANSLKNKHI